jgi:hypothetical protein
MVVSLFVSDGWLVVIGKGPSYAKASAGKAEGLGSAESKEKYSFKL